MNVLICQMGGGRTYALARLPFIFTSFCACAASDYHRGHVGRQEPHLRHPDLRCLRAQPRHAGVAHLSNTCPCPSACRLRRFHPWVHGGRVFRVFGGQSGSSGRVSGCTPVYVSVHIRPHPKWPAPIIITACLCVCLSVSGPSAVASGAPRGGGRRGKAAAA